MLKRIITNPYAQFICRAALGLVFIWASQDKITHPWTFAQAIAGYKVLTSPVLIKLTAVILPWVELLAGLMLLGRLWDRGANAVLSGLLVMFIVLIFSVIVRGIDTDCGCFGSDSSSKADWPRLLEDVALLVPSILIYLGFRWEKKPVDLQLTCATSIPSEPS
jgi:uncharacterized membrane protein YphA (DoxX/SURF4 family)